MRVLRCNNGSDEIKEALMKAISAGCNPAIDLQGEPLRLQSLEVNMKMAMYFTCRRAKKNVLNVSAYEWYQRHWEIRYNLWMQRREQLENFFQKGI